MKSIVKIIQLTVLSSTILGFNLVVAQDQDTEALAKAAQNPRGKIIDQPAVTVEQQF